MEDSTNRPADELVRERFDLDPPRPAASDVLEAIVDALDRACELATPQRTAARTLTLLARCRAALATVHEDGGAALISSLERLTGEWSR